MNLYKVINNKWEKTIDDKAYKMQKSINAFSRLSPCLRYNKYTRKANESFKVNGKINQMKKTNRNDNE